MNRLLLLRPISRALRAPGSASGSRILSRALSSTPSQNFGPTTVKNRRKKIDEVDDDLFGFGEPEVEVAVPEPAKAAKSGTTKRGPSPEVRLLDIADFAEESEEAIASLVEDLELSPEETYTTSVEKFEPDRYFASWFAPEAREALDSRGSTQHDYLCTLFETSAIQDLLSTLQMSEAEDFERLWGLYEWKNETDPQAVVPVLTFLLRRGLQLKPPSLDATKAEDGIELIPPDNVEKGLKGVKIVEWRLDDDSKPPSQMIPYPDLMQSDALLDPRDVTEFPATPEVPFNNRVIVRNHRSVFHSYAETTDDDLLEDDELDTDAQDRDGDIFKSLPVNNKYFSNLHQSILMRRSVVLQTGKGKIRRVAFMVLVGDGNGLVGYGEGKHSNSSSALRAARVAAVRNMDWVERFEKRTIWTEMSTKLGATQIFLRPRPVGFGLRCNPYLHQILRAAGLKDISGKVWGSRNRLNVIKAAFRMLHAGHAPTGMGDGIGGKGKKLSKGTGVRGKGEIERARGRKLISLRK